MKEESKFIKFFKKKIKKEVERKEELVRSIDTEIIKDVLSNESINKEDYDLEANNFDIDIIEINNKNEGIDGEKFEAEIKKIKAERIGNGMGDFIITRGNNPCEITNNLNQALLKIPKDVITPEEVANVGAMVNLGHLDNYEVLDVAFKYAKEVKNPCGEGTIKGDALLKAIVLVSTVHYSVILYNKVSKAEIYAGDTSAITAYSVYDIVKFDEDIKAPENIKPVFTITRFEQLPEDPTLNYYLFIVEGTADLIEA